MSKYFGSITKNDYIKHEGEKVPFWHFLDRQPDGWLTSLAYHRNDTPKDKRMIWDCGAWGYRKEKTPRLDGSDITPYYALQKYEEYAPPGSFVIAPDHMLMKDTNNDLRREFNRVSALEFLQISKDSPFEPMGVVHGLEPEEYLDRCKELLDAGYEAICVGGIASRGRAKRSNIEFVEQIREVTEGAWLHVLGLSAPEYFAAWDALGVESFDGASHFFQAFRAGIFLYVEDGDLVRHKATRADKKTKEPVGEITAPVCECKACSTLRSRGHDTRLYGYNQRNMGRAAHNMNMLLKAHDAIREDIVCLVSCVGKKTERPNPAERLYQSTWFNKAKEYAETASGEWGILSAKHGLVSPTDIIEPYDETLNNMPAADRKEWSRSVAKAIKDHYRSNTKIVVLAGKKYREYLLPLLHDDGYEVEVPMEGLGIGEQLGWLTDQNREGHSL